MAKDIRKEISTRKRIFDAAIQEFAQYGLAGARVDRIAELAGVNKAMIYYHFSSKEKLYQEILDHLVTSISSRMVPVFEIQADLETVLRRLSEAYHQQFCGRPDLASLLLYEIASGGRRLKKSLLGIPIKKGFPALIMSSFKDEREAGKLRAVDPLHAFISFVGMNLFYLYATPVLNAVPGIGDNKNFCKQRTDEIIDVFMHGLAK